MLIKIEARREAIGAAAQLVGAQEAGVEVPMVRRGEGGGEDARHGRQVCPLFGKEILPGNTDIAQAAEIGSALAGGRRHIHIGGPIKQIGQYDVDLRAGGHAEVKLRRGAQGPEIAARAQPPPTGAELAPCEGIKGGEEQGGGAKGLRNGGAVIMGPVVVGIPFSSSTRFPIPLFSFVSEADAAWAGIRSQGKLPARKIKPAKSTRNRGKPGLGFPEGKGIQTFLMVS